MKAFRKLAALLILPLALFTSCELLAPEIEEIENSVPYTVETDDEGGGERDKKPD